MVKTDFEILITGILVTIVLLVANIPATANKLAEIGSSVEAFKNDPIFKEFDKLKWEEKVIWARIKGEVPPKQPSVTPQNQTVTQLPQQNCNCDASEPDSTKPDQVNTNKPGEKIKTPASFLLVGDSMMLVGYGPSLEAKLLNYKDTTVVREGRFSTGLNRVDYFDWYKTTDELITANNTDVLIVMFGANDGQGIVDDAGNAFQLDNPQWDEVYRQRVNKYMQQFTGRVKRIYWIGQPIPKDDPNDTFSFYSKFTRMNKIYQEESKKFENIEFVESWSRFAVDGKYAPILADDNGLSQLVKGSDGVHVTDHGGNILADLTIKNMDEVELSAK